MHDTSKGSPHLQSQIQAVPVISSLYPSHISFSSFIFPAHPTGFSLASLPFLSFCHDNNNKACYVFINSIQIIFKKTHPRFVCLFQTDGRLAAVALNKNLESINCKIIHNKFIDILSTIQIWIKNVFIINLLKFYQQYKHELQNYS